MRFFRYFDIKIIKRNLLIFYNMPSFLARKKKTKTKRPVKFVRKNGTKASFKAHVENQKEEQGLSFELKNAVSINRELRFYYRGKYLSENAKEKEILHYLYEKWVNEPHKPTTMTDLIQKGVLEGEKDWYTKIEIMISKGLIASYFPKDAIIS
jgi:hypothetical protein